MSSDRSPIPHETRQAVLRMRKGGASYDEISRVLKVSKAWISGFLKKRDEEEQRIRAVVAPPPLPQAAPAPVVDLDQAGGPLAAAANANGDDIERLEGELRALYEMAGKTLDPVERVKISNSISSITARLALLRREEAKAKPTEKDDAVKRAGYAAADKFRALLEEALGERTPVDIDEAG